MLYLRERERERERERMCASQYVGHDHILDNFKLVLCIILSGVLQMHGKEFESLGSKMCLKMSLQMTLPILLLIAFDDEKDVVFVPSDGYKRTRALYTQIHIRRVWKNA